MRSLVLSRLGVVVEELSWHGLAPPPLPLPLELLLDMSVGEVEIDGGRLESVVAEDFLHGGQADALLQGGRGEGVAVMPNSA
jgi:hypothetical protein